MDSILSVRNIHIGFGSHNIIRGLSFDVHVRDNVVIIGPNGAGKTVLLKALLGLLPFQGEIHWASNVSLGYVPQKVAADRQLPLNVRDLLAAKTRFLKLSAQVVESVAEAVGLTEELLNTSVGIISGGQFQKALIAYALLGEPNVLLLDEPTASLDELAEEKIYELVERLQNERNLTVISVSHDLSIVYKSANRVLCLSRDRFCYGAPQVVLTPQMLESLYSSPLKYYRHQHANGDTKVQKSGEA